MNPLHVMDRIQSTMTSGTQQQQKQKQQQQQALRLSLDLRTSIY
jgi:hypothetical protein